MLQNIYLETDRLIIREHELKDLETHHALLSDQQTMYYMQDIMTHSYEESKKNLIESMGQKNLINRSQYFFRMESKANKEHIGEVGYTVIQQTPIGKIVHAGYFSYAKWWGKGYMTEAFREILRFAFEENDVIRVGTGCIKENIGSERVMQKCGLIKEAEHKCFEWHNNQLKDRVEYRLLKEEWELLFSCISKNIIL